MNIPTKFTQEIKDKWIADLKSGLNKQGFGTLYNEEDNSFCCYGRLSVIIGIDDLNSAISGPACDLMKNAVGQDKAEELWMSNDRQKDDTSYSRDFSNVLPLIEDLPVQN